MERKNIRGEAKISYVLYTPGGALRASRLRTVTHCIGSVRSVLV